MAEIHGITQPKSKVQLAVVLGVGDAHVIIEEMTTLAYSRNDAALTSFRMRENLVFTVLGRYLHLAMISDRNAWLRT